MQSITKMCSFIIGDVYFMPPPLPFQCRGVKIIFLMFTMKSGLELDQAFLFIKCYISQQQQPNESEAFLKMKNKFFWNKLLNFNFFLYCKSRILINPENLVTTTTFYAPTLENFREFIARETRRKFVNL